MPSPFQLSFGVNNKLRINLNLIETRFTCARKGPISGCCALLCEHNLSFLRRLHHESGQINRLNERTGK